MGTLLRDRKVDAPAISESRLGADFLTDRLPWVDAVHVAAHGEWAVGTEYLVLSPKDRLTVDDLLARHRRSVPFVYLNTCELGRTRYVGGGQARGLAYTLAELGAPAVVANTAAVLDEMSAEVAVAFYEHALELPVGEALLAARREATRTWHPALVSSVILFGDADHSIFGEEDVDEPDVAGEFLDAYFDGRDAAARLKTLDDADLIDAIVNGGPRERAALDLVNGFSKVTPETPYEGRIEEIGHAIALADELHHPCAMAMLRFVRASHAMDVPDESNTRRWIDDAIAHIDAVDNGNRIWAQALTRMRAAVRRDRMEKQGLQVQHHGPPDDSGVLDAVLDIKLAVAQAQEEERRPVEQRDIEEDVEDVLWNAVVAGHPNRFEDTSEASDYAAVVTRKLVAMGAFKDTDFERAHPMMTALLCWLWSRQDTTFLSSEMVKGQAGTLAVMVADIADGAIAAGDEPWRQDVLGFDSEVAAVLSELEKVPWERAHEEIPRRLEALGARAVAILDEVAKASPDALAWSAAYVSGVLATRNRFSVLECEDYLYEGMVAAHRSVDGGNEGRFWRYLMDGFRTVREKEPDELERWRMEGLAARAPDSDEEDDDNDMEGAMTDGEEDESDLEGVEPESKAAGPKLSREEREARIRDLLDQPPTGIDNLPEGLLALIIDESYLPVLEESLDADAPLTMICNAVKAIALCADWGWDHREIVSPDTSIPRLVALYEATGSRRVRLHVIDALFNFAPTDLPLSFLIDRLAKDPVPLKARILASMQFILDRPYLKDTIHEGVLPLLHSFCKEPLRTSVYTEEMMGEMDYRHWVFRCIRAVGTRARSRS
ncbi:CHAT domain-containing protein [Sinorhizobium sp. BG8]|uniref:CHAT domain-containing protein n=1 Tax=Sinorhizobium sp. BG8 TaxID=2613773 RepID=UPI001FED9038|nr:CHAT domain-containing protein [Sinorhizobium sp. BG8]